ncbi:MAG: NAD(P)(+) transhydrogenase (Re/Si-specific) subunit beta [Candidatus Hydrogenedentota bacterium]|nr:MAG: NAD(P)(+) transhydrogenase (Re/Si-specific) subunit beta [Candidatus Hydrogenedentota bacterium]
MLEFLEQKWLIDLIYLGSVLLFIFGIKNLSSPRTARKGNALSLTGMLIAVAVTLLDPVIIEHMRFDIIVPALFVGSLVGLIMAKKVKMTGMPQMVALLNGFGGIASALVAIAEYYENPATSADDTVHFITLVASIVVGSLTFVGSVVAFAKLQGLMPGRPMMVKSSKPINVILLLAVIVFGVLLGRSPQAEEYALAIAGIGSILGYTLVVPIGGADMPVVISLLNSYSGIAVALTGFVLKNNALIVVGSLVGASGIILTNIMCKGMNRSLTNVLFGGFGSDSTTGGEGGAVTGTVKSASPEEAGMILDMAESVIIVPGYGMAVSQAQHVVKSLATLLESRGANVRFAIHPVAGRMPGHMNVLLAEAGVDYDKLVEMERINDDFKNTDVAIVIGANDVVNPAAKNNPNSPIYGMPVLNVEEAKTVLVLKRSLNPGFAGIDNELFYKDNTLMVFGDAKKTVEEMIAALEELGD